MDAKPVGSTVKDEPIDDDNQKKKKRAVPKVTLSLPDRIALDAPRACM